MPATLKARAEPLAGTHDVALLDLDGVVYRGAEEIPGAATTLARAREMGMRLAFVTNNAARTPDQVAEHLRELGIHAEPGEVVTSAQAAAHYLTDRLPAGSPVLVIGADGLVTALHERGLRPVRSAADGPAAVVQGFAPDLSWSMLAEGAVAINAGVPWIATNLDPTVPSPRGRLPGNGSTVAALRVATGRTPVATGKPDPTMHREAVERSAAAHPVVVGDRLDTDIAGARAVGCPSLLVLTGVTDPADLLTAHDDSRPDYLGRDLTGLLQPHPAVDLDVAGRTARCGAWLVRGAAGTLTLHEHSAAAADSRRDGTDGLDPLRALAVAAWNHLGDAVVEPDATRIAAGSPRAAEALRRLHLGSD